MDIKWDDGGVSGIDGDEEDMVWLAVMVAGTGLGGDMR